MQPLEEYCARLSRCIAKVDREEAWYGLVCGRRGEEILQDHSVRGESQVGLIHNRDG